MKKFLIGFGIAFGILFLITSIIVGSLIGTYNKAQKFENSIIAEWQDMENINGIMVNKIKSSGFTVKNYSETFIKSIEAAAQRYADKPNLMMQWVQESQQNAPDKDVWIKLQNTIEGCYTEFAIAQRSKIDKVRVYKNFYMQFPNNVILSSFNLPSEKIKSIENLIISTENTKESFKTGKQDAINPFGN